MGHKKKKTKLGVKGQFLLIFLVLCAIAFSYVTIILLIGMLPSIAASFADRSPERMRGITIGALNLAGCSYFVFDVCLVDPSLEYALVLISQIDNLVIMWCSALLGYCLEWAISGSVSVYVAEGANARIKVIEKKQDSLVERWGEKVTGKIPLDEEGFPIEKG